MLRKAVVQTCMPGNAKVWFQFDIYFAHCESLLYLGVCSGHGWAVLATSVQLLMCRH